MNIETLYVVRDMVADTCAEVEKVFLEATSSAAIDIACGRRLQARGFLLQLNTLIANERKKVVDRSEQNAMIL